MQNTTIQSEFLDKAAKLPVVFFWFRRDLRLQDNAALFAAKQFA
ncbi:MAG: deoxyribodipyrimidine photo-lyase, partial [Leptospiraceae bacterium]|nr:deoxyribodipyrimidine photo-lyase [Leptospiraceae bacterium]